MSNDRGVIRPQRVHARTPARLHRQKLHQKNTYSLGASAVGHDDGLRARGAHVDARLDLHAGEGGGGGHESSHFVKSGWYVTEVYGCGNADRGASSGKVER